MRDRHVRTTFMPRHEQDGVGARTERRQLYRQPVSGGLEPLSKGCGLTGLFDFRRHFTFMGGGNRKTWQEMTRAEIRATLIAFTAIGTAIVAGSIYQLAQMGLGALALVPAAGILFVSVVVVTSYIQAIRELRRREKV